MLLMLATMAVMSRMVVMLKTVLAYLATRQFTETWQAQQKNCNQQHLFCYWRGFLFSALSSICVLCFFIFLNNFFWIHRHLPHMVWGKYWVLPFINCWIKVSNESVTRSSNELSNTIVWEDRIVEYDHGGFIHCERYNRPDHRVFFAKVTSQTTATSYKQADS